MIRNYFKIIMKILAKNKFFSFLSIFGISMTIMFITIVITMLENKMGPVAPEANKNKCLYIKRLKYVKDDNTNVGGLSLSFINKYLRNISFPHIESAQMFYPCEFLQNGSIFKKQIKYTDPEFWAINRFKFIEGRPFTKHEFENKENIMVINQSLKKILIGNEEASGKIIEFLGKKTKIIGVVEDVSLSCTNAYADIWMPYTISPGYNSEKLGNDYTGAFDFIILPKSTNSVAAIKGEIHDRMRKLNQSFKENEKVILAGPDTNIEAFSRGYADPEESKISSARFIGAWIGKFLLFMLLPALNLISINITRIKERSEEIAIRKSFGASKNTLIKQFISENLIITFIGGVIGILLSFGAMYLFRYNIFSYYYSEGIPLEVHYDFTIFIYAIVACLIFGLLSGIIPAIKMSRLHPAYILKGGIK